VADPVQGEIYLRESETDRRPVLVVTRSQAVPRLERIVVAPLTRTIRGIPTEVPIGPEDGVRFECVAKFDILETVRKTQLTRFVGSLGPRRAEICRALAALADC
jgi:mRNA interferase MazF